jgi:hypothetical protein
MRERSPGPRRSEQEARAVLHVTVPDPSIVTAAVGISPDSSWRVGEVRHPGARPAKFGAWRLKEDDIVVPRDAYFGAAVEGCLRRLLARVDAARVREGLAGLLPPLRACVVLTGYVYDLPNPIIPADLVAKIAELGADIEEDFYLIPRGFTEPEGGDG